MTTRKAINPIIRPWRGMTAEEHALLRYTARKHLDARLAKRKGRK